MEEPEDGTKENAPRIVVGDDEVQTDEPQMATDTALGPSEPKGANEEPVTEIYHLSVPTDPNAGTKNDESSDLVPPLCIALAGKNQK